MRFSKLILLLALGFIPQGFVFSAKAVEDANRSVLGSQDTLDDAEIEGPSVVPAAPATPATSAVAAGLPLIAPPAPAPAPEPAAVPVAPAKTIAPTPTPTPATPASVPATEKPSAPAYLPPETPEASAPKPSWDQANTFSSSRFSDAYRKYLDREEATVKEALTAAVMAMPTQDVKGNFSVVNPAKLKAKQAAVKALKTNYPPAFWAWLNQRPDIRQALFLTTHPTPPQYVANLAHLWKAAGEKHADKYAHLLLAASLRATPVTAGGEPYPVRLTPLEGNLVKLISQGSKEVPEPLVFFTHHKDKFAQGLNLPEAQLGQANMETLALVTGTYPQRITPSVADTVLRQIARLETKVPDFKDGIQWPLFHPDKAPYYLLNPLTQAVSDREQDYIWDRFAKPEVSIDGKPHGRLLGYGKYGWEYDTPEVRYRKSPWHPSTIPRIVEDGGVCGRMAQLESAGKNTLGIPSCTAGQPIHCALMFVAQNANGKFKADIGQSVTGNWTNTGPHLPVGITPAISGFEGTAVSWLAMAETANRISEADYYHSLFCAHAADDMPNLKDKIHLLKTAVNLNPYHLGAWNKLVACSAQMGPEAFNAVMLAMADRLAYPDGPPPPKVAEQGPQKDGKAANTGKDAQPAPAPVPQAPPVPRNATGDLIMRVCVAQMVPGNYDRMLAAGAKNPNQLVVGVRHMWQLMEACDDAGVMGGGDAVDAVFQKYAAMVNPAQAAELFKSNFERALLGRSDVYGATASPLTVVVNSFCDVGAKLPPAQRVGSLKAICEKVASVYPKYRTGTKATLVYGKTFDLSQVQSNSAYASALNQLVAALRADGQVGLAAQTLAAYQAEGARMAEQGRIEDRKRLSKDVQAQLEKIRAEDKKRL